MNNETYEKVLAIYPNAKGYAYAFMEGPLTLLEKKMIVISPVDNVKVINAVKQLLTEYTPTTLVLENAECKYSRKAERGKQLIRSLALIAKRKDVQVINYTREDIRFVFETWRAYTKYEIAEVIAKNISSMRMLLYPKPKYPRSQHYSEALFDAISLGITYYYKTT